MRALRVCYESAAKLGQNDDALMYGKQLLDVYQHFLAPFDPWLLILMQNLMKISMNGKNFQEAKNFAGILKPRLIEIFNSAPIFAQTLEFCERVNKLN